MKTFDITPHLAFFDEYVRRFRGNSDEDRENVDLKRDHSLRVLDEARMITASLSGDGNMTAELMHLVHLAALYHDLGRFPQYARWRTFDDSVSENHGRLGLKALREEGVIADLPEAQRKLVQTVVCLHNRRFMPRGLPVDVDTALRVVRDADKLDIIRVVLSYFSPDAHENSVVTLGLVDDPASYTPVLLERLASHKQAKYTEMQYFNDFRLMLMSWTYDLNFAASKMAVLERGFFDALAQGLPDKPELRDAVRRVRRDLEARPACSA